MLGAAACPAKHSRYNRCTMQGFSRLAPTQTCCALTRRPVCRFGSARGSPWPQHGHPAAAGAPRLPWTQGVSWSSITSPSREVPWAHSVDLNQCQTLQSFWCTVFLIQEISQNQNLFKTFSSYGLPPKWWLANPGLLVLPVEGT